MNDRIAPGMLAGPGIMILSAVLFGFFGFLYGVNWSSPGVDGNPVLFRVLAGWTLRVSAVVFLITAGLTFVRPLVGNLLYSIAGLLSAVMFAAVAVMDFADTRHGVFYLSEWIMLLFAAWNGYGSWAGLRAVQAVRRARTEATDFGP